MHIVKYINTHFHIPNTSAEENLDLDKIIPILCSVCMHFLEVFMYEKKCFRKYGV